MRVRDRRAANIFFLLLIETSSGGRMRNGGRVGEGRGTREGKDITA